MFPFKSLQKLEGNVRILFLWMYKMKTMETGEYRGWKGNLMTFLYSPLVQVDQYSKPKKKLKSK